MNILVTGANGQLGNEIRVLSAQHPEHNHFFTDIDDLNICDESAINQFVAKHAIQVIINCAAYTAVDKAEEERDLATRINTIAPGNLAQAARQRNIKLIHISTDYVFDGMGYAPYNEKVPANPKSVYGITKWRGEQQVSTYAKQYIIIRTSWLYSTFGHNFVKTMLKLGKERETLGVVFDQIGTPTYARDLAQVIYDIIAKNIPSGTYHYSNEGVCSWYDFTLAIHRLAGISTCDVRPLRSDEYPSKAHRPMYSVLDKTCIKKALNIRIPHWETSLKDCIHTLENYHQE